MILTAGGIVVCSSCGQERPDGDRFCGMCGTPLPHRPLSALGAEGTISLSRGPLETSSSHERMSTAVAGLLDLLGRSGVSPTSEEPCDEAPGPGSAVSQIASDPPADSAEPESRSLETPEDEPRFSTDRTGRIEPASEDPPRNFLEGVPRGPASQPEEAAAPDGLSPAEPDVSKFLDALAAIPDEPSKSTEAPHFPWMDDVLDQVEHEAAKTSAARDERPRFLDLLGDLSQPEVARDVPAPVVATPSLSQASEESKTIARSRVAAAGAKPFSRKHRWWMATAAALVFVALAIVQWRTEIADNSKRLEQRITDKVLELAASDEADANKGQAAPSADPIDLNNPPTQSQPTSTAQPENAVAANASGQALSPKENPGPPKVPEPARAATQVQPPPAAQAVPEAPKFTGPGAHEMMRAEQAKTAAGRSEWLWKATAKGNPDAPLQLAELYVTGDGVPRSCEQAMVLLKTAALGNNARACNRLASLYTTGTCVPRSQLEAYRWLSSALAADPNNQSAQHDRDLIWERMTPEERTLAQESR
jgi:zinc-ribbon domain